MRDESDIRRDIAHWESRLSSYEPGLAQVQIGEIIAKLYDELDLARKK